MSHAKILCLLKTCQLRALPLHVSRLDSAKDSLTGLADHTLRNKDEEVLRGLDDYLFPT